MAPTQNEVLKYLCKPVTEDPMVREAIASLPALLVSDSISNPSALDFLRKLSAEAGNLARSGQEGAPTEQAAARYQEIADRIYQSANMGERPVGPRKAELDTMQDMLKSLSRFYDRKARLSSAVAGMNMDDFMDVLLKKKPFDDAARAQGAQIEAGDKEALRSIRLVQGIHELSTGLSAAISSEAARAKPM